MAANISSKKEKAYALKN